MAGLRLNAADCKHEAARRIAPVGAQRERAGNVEGRDDLAGGADLDLLTDACSAQRVVYEGQRFQHRHADPVGELDRCCAGAAFGPVDDDEIGNDASFQHRLDHAEKLTAMTDAQFESDRLAAGQFTQLADELHQADRRRKGAVGGRRNAIDAHRNAAGFGNFRRNLRSWQHAAMSWLRALAQFQFDHLDLRVRGDHGELLRREAAVIVAATEIAGCNLIDQIPASFPVVAADATFASVMRKAAFPGARVQSKDGIGRQRAKAHRRNVVEAGIIRPTAGRPANAHAKIGVVEHDRHGGVSEPGIAGSVDILDGAEWALVFVTLGALIDEPTILPAERLRVAVALDQILPDLGAEAFEYEAQMADDRIVAQDRMPALNDIMHPDRGQDTRQERHRKKPRAIQRSDESQHRENCDARKHVETLVDDHDRCRRSTNQGENSSPPRIAR